jgi:hypothetical protein
MHSRSRLTLAVLVALVTLPAVASAKPYRAGDPLRISGPSPFAGGCPGAAFDDTHITGQELEPSITVNRANERNIVAAWKQDVGPRGMRADLTAASLDGGRTWTRNTIPGLSKCTGGEADGASDPWVTSDQGGTVYFVALQPLEMGQVGDPPSALGASHSFDGGRTWTTPATVASRHEGVETPSITGSPKRAGSAYAVWADFAFANILFSRTTDHGVTWSPSVVVDQPGATALDVSPRMVALPNGTLVTVFGRVDFATGLGGLFSARSRDGGRTWEPAVQLTSKPIETFADPETGEELPQPQFENVAVAPDGTIYVTVEANLSATQGVISVSKSCDGGRTWSTSTLPGVGGYAFEPAVAVDSKGTVGITWYDLRNDVPRDAALSGDIWFASSQDRGASWSQIHVAGPTDLRSGALARQNRFGEYQGLSPIGREGFAAIFTLASPQATDGPTDIFFSRIARGNSHHDR